MFCSLSIVLGSRLIKKQIIELSFDEYINFFECLIHNDNLNIYFPYKSITEISRHILKEQAVFNFLVDGQKCNIFIIGI